MKTTDFFDRLKLLLAIVLLSAFHSEGYSQAGLDENGRLNSDPYKVVDKNGAKGNGTARTVNGQIFVKSLVAVATLTTTAASSITASTAASGGNITADGGGAITDRGIVWNTVSTPTTALTTKTSDGTGTGVFTSSITGLSPSTTYYARSYAINSAGTAYGNEVSFTTGMPSPPVGRFAVCDNSQPTTVVEITAPSGRIWMDRNLGASRTALSATDVEAYGCLYQWGRGNDGHASITWTGSTSGTAVNGATLIVSTTDNPGNALFIDHPLGDWRSTENNDLWQGVDGINNPCPSGFRIPTITELETDITDGLVQPSMLFMKLTLSGNRYGNGDGSTTVFAQGDRGTGYYSSSTPSSGGYMNYRQAAKTFAISSSAGRADAYTVRCIKD